MLITLAVLLGLSLIVTGCGDTAGGIDIWDAVKRGDSNAIRRYAAAGGELDARDWGGSTPLWMALTEKNRNSYEALLKYGADPNVIMSGKRVVTHWAASEIDPWWLRLALEHGADPNLVNIGDGQAMEGTPLKFAINGGFEENVELVAQVRLLIEHGADVNKADSYKCHPLARSAQQNRFAIVLYLLEAGADYQAAECGGIPFLEDIRQKAVYREKEELMFHLEENRKNFDAVRAWLQKRGVDLGAN